MKSGFKTVVSVGVAVAAFHSISRADEQLAVTNQTENLSYSIGLNIGNSIKRAGFEVDAKVVGEAIGDVLADRQPRLTEKQAQECIAAAQQGLRAKRDQERIKLAAKNHEAGQKFLADNKRKEGVKTHEVKLADGSTAELQYQVLSEGTGDSPKAEDTATFNFRASTIDGKEIKSGPEKAIVKNYQIAGVKEALQLMKPGAKWKLFIPSELAFRDMGAGPTIEPGAAIVYELDLISAEAPQAPQPLTSDIIKVPSKEELDKGAKIEVIKSEDVKKMQTNPPAKGAKK